MTRDQMTWLGGGLAFGFVAGFVLAYAMAVDTTVGGAAPPASVAPQASAQAGSAAAPQGDPHIDVRGLLDDLNRRLEENPDDVQVLSQMAEIYMQAGMAEQALEFIDRLEAAEPGMFQSSLLKAMALDGLDRQEEFSALVSSMAETFPDRWESHYLLASYLINHHRDEGDLARARRELDRIEELRPEMPEAASLRAELERVEQSHNHGDESPG